MEILPEKAMLPAKGFARGVSDDGLSVSTDDTSRRGSGGGGGGCSARSGLKMRFRRMSSASESEASDDYGRVAQSPEVLGATLWCRLRP